MENKLYLNTLDKIHSKLIKNGTKFTSVSPMPSAVDGIYDISGGDQWTDSFFVGMLWLDFMRNKSNEVSENIKLQMEEFENRINEMRGLDHHDIGFLYILSAVAGYKATAEEKYKELALRAARLLAKRYHKSAHFIQAWGDPNSRDNYRLIIDCMLNIPLLYWAAEVMGDKDLYDIAYNHAKTTNKVIFRPDNSTHHTYYFDYETGLPLEGKTRQGAHDDSAWARGQVWAMYGFALSYRYTKDEEFLKASKKATEYFLSHQPEDNVCYWDLCFSDGDNEPRDSSAAAIAVCALLELFDLTGKEAYRSNADKILTSLCEHYLSSDDKESVLDHAVYSYPDNYGVDEACIWGDYYFMEALCRITTDEDFKLFW